MLADVLHTLERCLIIAATIMLTIRVWRAAGLPWEREHPYFAWATIAGASFAGAPWASQCSAISPQALLCAAVIGLGAVGLHKVTKAVGHQYRAPGRVSLTRPLSLIIPPPRYKRIRIR